METSLYIGMDNFFCLEIFITLDHYKANIEIFYDSRARNIIVLFNLNCCGLMFDIYQFLTFPLGAIHKVRTPQNGHFWNPYPPLYSKIRFCLTLQPIQVYSCDTKYNDCKKIQEYETN